MVESIKIQHLEAGEVDDESIFYTRKFNEGFLMTNIDGLGPVEATVNITQFASGDGGIFNSSRRSSRNIVITGKITESRRNGYISFENTRDRLNELCPPGDPVKLEIDIDHKQLKTIYGYIDKLEVDYFGNLEGAQISVLCPMPDFHVEQIQNP